MQAENSNVLANHRQKTKERFMTFQSASALVLATLIFAAMPGPGVTAIVSQAVARGLRQALWWTAGIMLGDVIYITLVLLGLSFTAGRLGSAFVVLKWLGAAYLIFLGLRCLLAKPPASLTTPAKAETAAVLPPSRPARAFFAGLCVSLGNPKVIAFYCGFLPGFVDLHSLSFADAALVVALVPGTVLLVLVSYAFLGARGGGRLRSLRTWKVANRTAGAVMLGTGAVVAAN